MESMVNTLKLGNSNAAIVSSTDPEQLHAYEKKLLEDRRVLPLVALPWLRRAGERRDRRHEVTEMQGDSRPDAEIFSLS